MPQKCGAGVRNSTPTRFLACRSPQVNDPAFLFFLRFRVHQNQHFAVIDFMAEVEQAAMGTHHQRLADFAKFPPSWLRPRACNRIL